MSYKAYYHSSEGDLRRNLSEEEIKVSCKSGQGLLWVDIVDMKEEHNKLMEQAFHFHPLAVGDCMSTACQHRRQHPEL